MSKHVFGAICLVVAVPASLTVSGASTCQVFRGDRDHSLLQAHQVLNHVQTEPEQTYGITSAPEASGWLGWGHHVATGDFWHMQNLNGENLFTEQMPGTCFEDAHCRNAHTTKSHQFESVDSWASYYSSNFDLGISGGFKGFSGSVDASLGQTTSSSVEESRRLAYAVTTHQRKCYRLVRNARCAYNRTYVQPAFLERIKSLPQGEPYTVEKMEAWNAGIVQRFGTHITVASSHGALVHALVSADARFEKNYACLDSGLCLKFGWVGAGSASAELCSETATCDNKTRSSQTDTSSCVALGGDPSLQSQICREGVDKTIVDAWLAGGDLHVGSSAYRFSFMPISEFLTNVDFDEYFETARTLEKAVEYSNCRMNEVPAVQDWDGSQCRCVRQCANGGVLDEATCTCKCRGNLQHGFKGPDCQEEYGSCQPGPGTGNVGAAKRCPAHGRCSSWYDTHVCKATDVCCATNVGTTCCPFGSSCRCGTHNCQCVTGE